MTTEQYEDFEVLSFFLARAVIVEDYIIDTMRKLDELTMLVTAIEVASFETFLDKK